LRRSRHQARALLDAEFLPELRAAEDLKHLDAPVGVAHVEHALQREPADVVVEADVLEWLVRRRLLRLADLFDLKLDLALLLHLLERIAVHLCRIVDSSLAPEPLKFPGKLGEDRCLERQLAAGWL
jgi:hypothetical protein